MAGLSQTHFAALSWLFAADSRLANDEQPPCPDERLALSYPPASLISQ